MIFIFLQFSLFCRHIPYLCNAMKRLFCIYLVANLLLGSCTPDCDSIDPNNTYFLDIVEEKEVSLDYFLRYDEVQEYAPNIGDYLDPLLGDRVIGITVLKYRTLDPYLALK